MHDARAIANFFIDRAIGRSQPISAMTLLKVLYFAHAWHLAKFNSPLVAQPFEAWRNGPVVRVVYDQIKGMGAKPINFSLQSFNPCKGFFTATSCDLEVSLQSFLNNIFDFYTSFHSYALSDLTHETGSPWDQVWTKAEKGAVPGMSISNEEIRSWFLRSGPEHLRSAKQRYTI